MNLRVLLPLFLNKKLIDFSLPITEFLKEHLSSKSSGKFSNNMSYKNPYPCILNLEFSYWLRRVWTLISHTFAPTSVGLNYTLKVAYDFGASADVVESILKH